VTVSTRLKARHRARFVNAALRRFRARCAAFEQWNDVRAIHVHEKPCAPRIGFVRSCQTATGHGLVTYEVKRTLANRNEP
jgi:hypothetical protein